MVATYDARIEEACRELGIDCIRTGGHLTGTDRVAECAERLHAYVYINVQGDESFIEPSAIDAVSEVLADLDNRALAVNAYTELRDTAAVLDHNVVKVVVSIDSQAVMFSRQAIPYPRSSRPSFLRQLGLYGFTREALECFRQLPRALSNRPRASRCCGSSSTATASGCCPCPTTASRSTPQRISPAPPPCSPTGLQHTCASGHRQLPGSPQPQHPCVPPDAPSPSTAATSDTPRKRLRPPHA